MRRTNKTKLDFKRLVLDRLETIGMTQAELVERLDGRVAPSTVYRFLDRGQRMPVKSGSLAQILGVLGAEIFFKK